MTTTTKTTTTTTTGTHDVRRASSTSPSDGHYGRVFSLSFSPAFSDTDDDDDEEEEEEEEEEDEEDVLSSRADDRRRRRPRRRRRRRRKRLLATSGEDDCCRLWRTTTPAVRDDDTRGGGGGGVLLEPKPSGASVLRGHQDAVLKCAFGGRAFRTSSSSGSLRKEEDDNNNNNNNNNNNKKEEEEFLLATGSSNGEVFVWAVSGKRRKNEASSERVLAKFNANAAQSEGSMRENNDDEKDDDAEDKEENEVYGLTFLGCKDEYLIIATDAELIGVEVVTGTSENGALSVELKEITRTRLRFSLKTSDENIRGRNKFDFAYAFAMDAYATNNSDNRMGDKHIMSVGYSNGTMRMYCFDAKAREFYIVGENASVFDSGEGGEGIRKNMACTSLIFVNPAAENEYEQFPNVLMCNRFGLLAMSDVKNWIEQTKPRMNLQTDFALAHSIADVGNGFVACCGRMKEDNVNGVALFDAFDVQRGSIFLNASEMMGEHASMYPLLCVGGFAEDVTVSADDDNEDDVTNRQIRITVVAAGGMPAKLVAEKFSNRTNVKSIGFSLGNMKVGGKRDDEEEKNTKTSRIYAWEFII